MSLVLNDHCTIMLLNTPRFTDFIVGGVCDPQDHGFMFGRSFRDIDGHVWEVVWMDPAAMSDES